MIRSFVSRLAIILAVVFLGGCESPGTESDVVWAVNVGGPGYVAVDGTRYVAEESVGGGELAHLASVKGSQDPQLYQTYREGDIFIAHTMADGTYDLTFHFAEPDDIDRDERLFDVFVEGQRVADDIDVMLFRDGQVRAALTVTVPNVPVNDGELNISFEASVREPLLSALVVRRKERPEESWQIAWSDEFDTDGAPDRDNWNIEEWTSGVVNDEDQVYTARAKNVRVRDGLLVIEAHKEEYDGAQYTSARIQSSGKADFLYGRIEARAKLPKGQGSWPAIWMLPSEPFFYATNCSEGVEWQGNEDCDAWPNSGEIDIMEHVGYQTDHIHGTVHSRDYYWKLWNQRKGRLLLDDVTDAFHVYSIEWTPDRIDIFVDDTVYLTYINEQNGWQEWPFDKPFHLILNYAVGGGWGRAGGPIDDSVFPQQMLVDYVRVYRQPD